MGAYAILGISTLVWVLRGAAYLVAWRHRKRRGPPWWFAVAPAGALVVVMLLEANVPLRVRWQLAKGDFADAVTSARANPPAGASSSKRIGTYQITRVEVVGSNVIFWEKEGAFSDDAGFAYLPAGPSPELAESRFENPQWFGLGDGWYSWTASW